MDPELIKLMGGGRAGLGGEITQPSPHNLTRVSALVAVSGFIAGTVPHACISSKSAGISGTGADDDNESYKVHLPYFQCTSKGRQMLKMRRMSVHC